jgi:hypothetical protein
MYECMYVQRVMRYARMTRGKIKPERNQSKDNVKIQQSNKRIVLLSSLRPKLDSRQPLPTLVFIPFNDHVVGAEFTVKLFLRKWRRNRCNRVRKRRDDGGRDNANWRSTLHCALPIDIESWRDTRVSDALRTHTNLCVPPRTSKKCRFIHICISIFLILLRHRE